ncbi:hypothetical protein [Flavobacterium branchiophilum]|uniref:Uncharacterized protein n=1 Tax=Flavobacterium branchiophilum TaxID=55197 RepID=A0A2H3KKK2_9FLAO|nr:hypothetical protein [Flavobacterium branchiophilum]PDS23237.1 hypothetical protein B0A77_11275 [Flavobacterium branchiophilum]
MSKETYVTGDIIETTGGNYKEYANCLEINAKQIIQKADKITYKKPKKFKPKTDLLITKVEGPFDENNKLVNKIGFRKYYTYKATPSRKPTEYEIKMLKWATKSDDGKIKELGGTTSANQLDKEGKLLINVAINQDCEKARVYAYFKKAIEKSSVEVNMLEPLIIYVCGYWNKDMPYAGDQWNEKYWGDKMKNSSKKYFNNAKQIFLNGAGTWHSQGSTRFASGQKYAENRYDNVQSKLYKEVFQTKRKIMIVSYSMGAAFAEGMLKILLSKGTKVEKVVHLSPADTSQFSANLPDKTYQIDIDWDPVLMYKNADDTTVLKGIKAAGIFKNPKKDEFGHMYTKEEDFVWKWFEDLELVKFQFLNEEVKTYSTPSSGMGYGGSSYQVVQKNYKAINILNKTVFERVMKNGEFYFYDEKNKNYYTES